MGADNPIAVLSNRPKPLYNYFKQNFAQVTNPPIDPIREELVMSLVSLIGPRPTCSTSRRRHPHAPGGRAADPDQRGYGAHPRHREDHRRCLPHPYPGHLLRAERGAAGMEAALRCCAARQPGGARGLQHPDPVRSRRKRERIAIPALLATSAVHHHLVNAGLRTECGLVVETGAAREVHHFAVLAGYGAEAINPWLAFETLHAHPRAAPEKHRRSRGAEKRYIKAIGKGLLKVMSKMGISTYQSYCGAQIFDAVGLQPLRREIFHRHRVDGRGHRPAGGRRGSVRWHRDAWGDAPIYRNALDVGGDYMPSASAASTTPGRRTRSPSCSTRRARTAGRPTRNTPRRSTDRTNSF
jgi:glutamate synthase (NADPH) large chain